MTSHYACTSGTSRVITVVSLQRLKMEVLIPVTADCEVRSVIKFLNAQSIAPIKIHRQLCQVFGHTRLDGQHISCKSSAGRCLIIHSIARTSRQWFPFFLHLKKFLFWGWQRGGDECHRDSKPRRQTSTTQDTKVGLTIWQISQFRRWMWWKIVQYLLFCSNKSFH